MVRLSEAFTAAAASNIQRLGLEQITLPRFLRIVRGANSIDLATWLRLPNRDRAGMRQAA